MLNVSIATIITINKFDQTVTRENVMSLAHQVVRGIRAVIRGESYADMFKAAIKALYNIIKAAEAKAREEITKQHTRRINALIVGYGFMHKDLIRYTHYQGFRIEEFEALQEGRDIFKNNMFANTKAVALTKSQREDIARRLKNHTEVLLNELCQYLSENEKEIAKENFKTTFSPLPADEAFLWQ